MGTTRLGATRAVGPTHPASVAPSSTALDGTLPSVSSSVTRRRGISHLLAPSAESLALRLDLHFLTVKAYAKGLITAESFEREETEWRELLNQVSWIGASC